MKNTITVNIKLFNMAMEYEMGLAPADEEIMELFMDSLNPDDYVTADQHLFTIRNCEKYKLDYDVDTNTIDTVSYGLIEPQVYFRTILTEFRKYIYQRYNRIKNTRI
jgi:hypothetical protein